MKLRDFSLTYDSVYGLLPAQVVEVRVFRPRTQPPVWWAKFKVVPPTTHGQTYIKTISIEHDGVGPPLTVMHLISVVEKKIQEESTRRANVDEAARVAAALKAGT